MAFIIKPTLKLCGSKTGELQHITAHDISYMLTFKPNATHLDDPFKVDHCWSFEVDGRPHSIWSFKKSHHHGIWSTHGLDTVFEIIFGEHYVPAHKIISKAAGLK